MEWDFFFLAPSFPALTIVVNHRVSMMRRASGEIFIAVGLVGILGISRYRVSLDFAMWLINPGWLLFAEALLLTLWKLYLSISELNHVEQVNRMHVHSYA